MNARCVSFVGIPPNLGQDCRDMDSACDGGHSYTDLASCYSFHQKVHGKSPLSTENHVTGRPAAEVTHPSAHQGQLGFVLECETRA